MSRLAIFDIDGTLTDTNAVDDECFLGAVAEVLGIHARHLDWSAAPHVTDSAIVRWMCEAHHGRAPNDSELQRLVERFVDRLRTELERERTRFAPIAGAPVVFAGLRAAGWDLALATGGWHESARLKLAASGLDDRDLVLACASDALSREEIVALARDRAMARSGRTYARIVSVGDGVWDVKTAAALGLPFVGIATGRRAEALEAAGASSILPDLADFGAVCQALDTARVPGAREPGAPLA